MEIEVTEEGVGAVQGEDLVNNVVAFAVWIRGLGGREGNGREDVGGAAGLRTEGEQRDVAD